MKKHEIFRENLIQLRLAIINQINAIFTKLENKELAPVVDLSDYSTINFAVIDDQFSDTIRSVRFDTVTICSAYENDYDVPLNELSNDILLSILEIIEDNETEILAD